MNRILVLVQFYCIQMQLDSGIRYFDVRPYYAGDGVILIQHCTVSLVT